MHRPTSLGQRPHSWWPGSNFPSCLPRNLKQSERFWKSERNDCKMIAECLRTSATFCSEGPSSRPPFLPLPPLPAPLSGGQNPTHSQASWWRLQGCGATWCRSFTQPPVELLTIFPWAGSKEKIHSSELPLRKPICLSLQARVAVLEVEVIHWKHSSRNFDWFQGSLAVDFSKVIGEVFRFHSGTHQNHLRSKVQQSRISTANHLNLFEVCQKKIHDVSLRGDDGSCESPNIQQLLGFHQAICLLQSYFASDPWATLFGWAFHWTCPCFQTRNPPKKWLKQKSVVIH